MSKSSYRIKCFNLVTFAYLLFSPGFAPTPRPLKFSKAILVTPNSFSFRQFPWIPTLIGTLLGRVALIFSLLLLFLSPDKFGSCLNALLRFQTLALPSGAPW
eukprot:scaffold51435_cov63-Attheya_sp.AAC.7